MKRMISLLIGTTMVGTLVVSACAQANQNAAPATTQKAAVAQPKTTQPQVAQASTPAAEPAKAEKPATAAPKTTAATKTTAAAKPAASAAGGDTVEMIARCIEIPGTFPPNDLYNYVYVMKYRVVKVIKGAYAAKEILVGEYNPLIPRSQIKDKMKPYVEGDVQKFEVGAMHKLTLIQPINKVWKDAMEDEFFDSDMTKYYALKTFVSK
jgi:hypothetical protein